MFHAALLQTHVPNDDQLFPGQMDMQLALGEDWEGKWAVEKIILHSKFGEESRPQAIRGVEAKTRWAINVENESTIIPIFMPCIYRYVEPSNILRISS